jgi:hypothetical protein
MKNREMGRVYAAVIGLSAGLAALPGTAFAQDAPLVLQRGDVIHLDVDYNLVRTSPQGDVGDTVCFKRGSKFEVVRAVTGQTLLRRKSRWTFGSEANASLALACDQTTSLGLPGDDRSLYKPNDPVEIPKDFYRHFGITHGALFVPFKRRSDKSLSGESNLGYFVGYRFGGPLGVAITPAASVGMSLVNITDDSATTGSSVRDSGTRAAFTWSTGFILTHLDAFQIGIFVGQDRLGGDVGSSWKYEGKYWTSIAFGYAFTR